MRRILSSFAFTLLALSALTTNVRADPVRTVTSGFFRQVDILGEEIQSGWEIMGRGFAASGGSAHESGGAPCKDYTCAPGDVIDFTFSVGEFISDSGITRIDDLVCGGSEFEQCDGIINLEVSGGRQRIPESGPPFTLTLPMTLTGNISIFKCTEPGRGCAGEFGELLASISIRGRGTGIITFIFDPEVRIMRLRNFQYTSKPIPEPATLLLLGTGLASIGGVLRKRRGGKEK